MVISRCSGGLGPSPIVGWIDEEGFRSEVDGIGGFFSLSVMGF
jgi:hypothetical protein